jgi:hypothetical protein
MPNAARERSWMEKHNGCHNERDTTAATFTARWKHARYCNSPAAKASRLHAWTLLHCPADCHAVQTTDSKAWPQSTVSQQLCSRLLRTGGQHEPYHIPVLHDQVMSVKAAASNSKVTPILQPQPENSKQWKPTPQLAERTAATACCKTLDRLLQECCMCPLLQQHLVVTAASD